MHLCHGPYAGAWSPHRSKRSRVDQGPGVEVLEEPLANRGIAFTAGARAKI